MAHPVYPTGCNVTQFPDKNKLCNVASCWIYIRIWLNVQHSCSIFRTSGFDSRPTDWLSSQRFVVIFAWKSRTPNQPRPSPRESLRAINISFDCVGTDVCAGETTPLNTNQPDKVRTAWQWSAFMQAPLHRQGNNYIFWVSVCSLISNMQCTCAILSFVACPALNMFQHCCANGTTSVWNTYF